ncbi:hypothetical protein BJ875DRAFT_543434 [Amylocarpus encephaloides]|uniref:Uncharacterized protein n=1 Tax=Amylocarpus encephaloides TaxID=45428 RepID=A0A9P7YHN2_9HELO|nr:hypothetical protein BJ875DRAFT_543434 [Amylocarpus encephaloides]
MPSLNTLAASACLLLRLASAFPSADQFTHFPDASEAALIERRGASFNTYGDHSGETSSYDTNSGTYVDSADEHRYASRVKCWTDLMFVANERIAVNWHKTDSELDCGGTRNPDGSPKPSGNSCTSNQAVTATACVTHTNGGTVEAGIDLGVAQKLGNMAEASGSIKFGGSYVHLDAKQTCTTTSTSNTCGWSDDNCHAVWVSPVSNRVHGYVRRRCSSANGDYTAWSHDHSYDLPTTIMRLGCDALCSEESYPGSVPQ